MSLQNLPPSMKDRTRYLIFEVECEEEIELGGLVDAVWKSLLNFMGELEVSKADPWIMKELFDGDSQVAGVRVNHEYVAEVRSALALIQQIDAGGQHSPAHIHTLGVSGSMEKAREKYIENR